MLPMAEAAGRGEDRGETAGHQRGAAGLLCGHGRLLLDLKRLTYSIPVLKYGVKMTAPLTIGTLAKQAGVNVETIRFYQRRRLLDEPKKPLGGIRRYTQTHARRIRFIKEAQKLGFGLDEVADLLALEDGRHCREVEEIAGHKLAVVRERLAQLSKIEKLLSVLVGRCHGNSGKVRCPLIASLERATA